ncbi:MAG TPA: Holliday junction branch migration protein RuvA [Armatimonadetes bacterium]|nr:Holliday junction branch migration protein RuvA [Armatimonadota bacterium]
MVREVGEERLPFLSYVKGRLVRKLRGGALVEVGNFGLFISMPERSVEELPPEGEEVFLFTFPVLRGEELEVYGFVSEAERRTFELLSSLPRIGPSLALNVLSALTPEELLAAVAEGDEARLAQARGVGPERARRILFELRRRVEELAPPVGEPKAVEEVVRALMALGLSRREAVGVAREAAREAGEGAPLDDLIKLALRKVGGG